MRIRNLALIASAAAIAFSTVSCGTSGVSGKPASSNRSEHTPSKVVGKSSSKDPTASVPSVSNPLNVKTFLNPKEICYIISEEQAKKLGFDRPQAKPKHDPYGSFCGVSDNGEGENNLDIGIQKNLSLHDVYEKRTDWPYFKPEEVQNYPLVLGAVHDYRSKGVCRAHLAVSNRQTSDITYTDNATKSAKKSCDMAKRAASEVVTTLKGAK